MKELYVESGVLVVCLQCFVILILNVLVLVLGQCVDGWWQVQMVVVVVLFGEMLCYVFQLGVVEWFVGVFVVGIGWLIEYLCQGWCCWQQGVVEQFEGF